MRKKQKKTGAVTKIPRQTAKKAGQKPWFVSQKKIYKKKREPT